jgi:hypothetical protein
MTQPRPLQDVHAELADEHRRLMALVSLLEAERSIAKLPLMLRELHDLLVDHFAHEQFPGGLYEQMGAYGSQHHEDLRVLIREHCDVLSAARALLEHSERPQHDSGLLDQVARLLDALRAHELEEHRLVRKLEGDGA